MKKILFTLLLSFLLLSCKQASALLDNMVQAKTPHYYSSQNLALQSCQLNKALQLTQKHKETLLGASELGLAYYFNHNYQASNEYFEYAVKEYQLQENQALFDLSSLLSKTYQMDGYEKVFLHNYKAINYLIMEKLESARVEARNANTLQEEEKMKSQQFKSYKDKKNKHILSRYEKLFNHVNPQHNPYQNPLAYYLSALSYAGNHEYEQALVDIREAMKLMPNNKLLKDKLKCYKEQNSTQSVELFFDVGQSPIKSQVKMRLKMSNHETRVAYLPSFHLSISDVDHIKIIDSKKNSVTKSSLLVDINAIKINDFKEKLPSLLRILSEQPSIELASNAIDQKSKLLASLFKASAVVYEKENLQTWSFLPQKVLVASFIPKKKEYYTLCLVSKKGDILYQKPLKWSNKKRKLVIEHFTIKKNRLCL